MFRITGLMLVLIAGAVGNTARADDTIHHQMTIKLEPATHRIEATDLITIPASLARNGMILKINTDLAVEQIGEQTGGEVSIAQVGGATEAGDVGIDREISGPQATITVNEYAISGITDGEAVRLTLKLEGTINNPVEELAQEYARGFSRSSGLIEERGVYLTGATYWVPTVAGTMITYDISVTLPEGWSSVSQGARTEHGWNATTPTEEIYLIAARFHEYSLPAGNVTAMAFLRTQDDALANRYLETTAQYLEMYRGLLGPYPYTKFALVENFWETGYGMPSFTLLGPQIIRFPFILHSSYPHELLHNWWGNGVFVDFDGGNWAEGLTAYMADHLVAEQRGQGAEYRRAILQRYTNYVDGTTDFPLTEFRGRYNAPTEAVGYGKTGMTWNMLRVLVGDDNFRRGFQRFYRNFKYRNGSFNDIRDTFESVTGMDLKPFFHQWVEGTGAPELRLSDARQEGGKLKFTLEQIQAGDAYAIPVTIAVYTAGTATRHVVEMDTKSQTFDIAVEGDVARVEVDPDVDIFRRLHWAETPPSLGNAFGADTILMVLPSEASEEAKARYERLVEIWSTGNDKMHYMWDTEVERLFTGGAVWVLGTENLYYGAITDALGDYDAEINGTDVRFGQTTLPLADNSSIIAVRHPDDPETVIVGLTAHSDAAIEGLARKLPHYGKYSYLAFSGDAPDNSAKGEWPAVGSPLVAVLDPDITPTATLTPRPALAQLKPVFDGARMMADVEYLAAPGLKGRGVGSDGLNQAASYIANAFNKAGLSPAGDFVDPAIDVAGSPVTWMQNFKVPGPEGKPVPVKNVVGMIPGKNPDMAGQSVVISAHYDHLGYGWPDVRQAFVGQVHPGADDNASGVAVLLELARSLAKSAPDRTIIFLATTAEESGLLGARHYAASGANALKGDLPANKAIANVNLDTVGRAKDKFLVFGGSSATEWRFIFLGTTATTGIATELVMSEVNASDHTAFAEIGVPAIHLFGSAHGDYHRPSDTADKIDPGSLVKAAQLAKEVVEYLGGRPEPLTSTITANSARPQRPSAGGGGQGGGRRVSTGTMPDFTFSGGGVKVSSVAEGSAGAKAGLLGGDIIIRFGGVTVADLGAYTAELSKYAPGDTVSVTVTRDGEEVALELVLAAR